MTNSQTEEIISRIKKAAENRNFHMVIELASVGKEAEAVEQRQKEIKEKLTGLNGSALPVERPQYRNCLIEVTRGGLKYSYLLVSGPIRKQILTKNEKLKIHIPVTGETFTTEIYFRNKNLKEREAIGRFYKAADVKVGDMLVLTETAPNEWTLTKSGL
jgi:hypothetical protein